MSPLHRVFFFLFFFSIGLGLTSLPCVLLSPTNFQSVQGSSHTCNKSLTWNTIFSLWLFVPQFPLFPPHNISSAHSCFPCQGSSHYQPKVTEGHYTGAGAASHQHVLQPWVAQQISTRRSAGSENPSWLEMARCGFWAASCWAMWWEELSCPELWWDRGFGLPAVGQVLTSTVMLWAAAPHVPALTWRLTVLSPAWTGLSSVPPGKHLTGASGDGSLGVWMVFQEQVSGLRNPAPTSKYHDLACRCFRRCFHSRTYSWPALFANIVLLFWYCLQPVQ